MANPSIICECLCEEDDPEPDYRALYEECVASHQRQNATVEESLDLLLRVLDHLNGRVSDATIRDDIDRFLNT